MNFNAAIGATALVAIFGILFGQCAPTPGECSTACERGGLAMKSVSAAEGCVCAEKK